MGALGTSFSFYLLSSSLVSLGFEYSLPLNSTELDLNVRFDERDEDSEEEREQEYNLYRLSARSKGGYNFFLRLKFEL